MIYLTSILQRLDSESQQPILAANRIENILKTTPLYHGLPLLSGDFSDQSGTREVSAMLRIISIWVNGSRFLKGKKWPFQPTKEVFKKICLSCPAIETNKGLQQASFLSRCCRNKRLTCLLGTKFSSLRKIQRVNARLDFNGKIVIPLHALLELRLRPNHKHNCIKLW